MQYVGIVIPAYEFVDMRKKFVFGQTFFQLQQIDGLLYAASPSRKGNFMDFLSDRRNFTYEEQTICRFR